MQLYLFDPNEILYLMKSNNMQGEYDFSDAKRAHNVAHLNRLREQCENSTQLPKFNLVKHRINAFDTILDPVQWQNGIRDAW